MGTSQIWSPKYRRMSQSKVKNIERLFENQQPHTVNQNREPIVYNPRWTTVGASKQF